MLRIMLVFIGLFVDFGAVTTALAGTGLVLMLFTNDLIHSIASFVKRFKQELKEQKIS